MTRITVRWAIRRRPDVVSESGAPCMQLELEVCGNTDGIPAPAARRVFNGTGGVIGRGAGCDWVLADASRLLSSHHGLVGFRDGRYFLTDISSNGIGMAGSDERLRRGQAQPIDDGDVFELGPLAIRARLIAPVPRFAEPYVHKPSHAEKAPIPDDAFLGLDPVHLMDHEHSREALSPELEALRTTDEASPPCVGPGTPEWDHLLTPNLVAPVLPTPVPVVVAPQANDVFWAQFADALGLPLDKLGMPGREAAAIKVASLFKQTLDDLQQSLRTQDELLGELNVGAAGSILNSHNPLRDCRGLQATLEALLGAGTLGELSAERAIAQAFRDLQTHQVALLAACRAAVRGARKPLAPGNLQQDLERQDKPPRLFTDGAHWRAYQRYYQRLMDAEPSGERDLGRDFAKAYDEQVRLINTLHAAYPG